MLHVDIERTMKPTTYLLTLCAVCLGTVELATSAEFFPLGFGITVNIHLDHIAVSQDGSVAGASNDGQLIKWTRSTGPEVILDSFVYHVDMSGDGTTIVTSRLIEGSPDSPHVFFEAIKIVNGDVQVLPVFPSTKNSEARLISQDGSTVVGFVGPEDEAGDKYSVRWIDDEISGIPIVPYGVSANGDVVVGDMHRWTETDGTQPLPSPVPITELEDANAFAVSADGRWTVGRINEASLMTQRQAMRWDGLSSFERLLPSNPDWGAAGSAVTADGGQVAGRLYLNDDVEDRYGLIAGIWTEETGVMMPLQDLLVEQFGMSDQLEGWHLTGVYDMSDDGRFLVGHAFNLERASDEAFLVDLSPNLPGDFNADSQLDARDIDELSVVIRLGTHSTRYDLTDDDLVNGDDRAMWVHELKRTYFGDANLDGEFKSSDFVQVFQAGTYETGTEAGWSEGDWNGDSVFTSDDFITAFQDGGYEQGPRTDVVAVPEPGSFMLLILSLCGFISKRNVR